MQNKFKEVLRRFLANDSNEKDNKIIDDFIEGLQQKPYQQIEDIQGDIKLKNSIFSKIKYRTTKKKKRKYIAYFTLFISLIFISSITYFNLQNDSSSSLLKITSRDKSEIFHLQDGSIVELFANSYLIISNDFNVSKREVVLKGEAFFKVFKDPERPFIINSDGFQTKVLGTSFLIKKDLVSVKTGRVKVSNSDNLDNYIILESNQKVIRYDNKLYRDTIDKLQLVCSNSQDLNIKQQTLESWKTIIEKEFEISIELKLQDTIKDIPITGDFRNTTLESILTSVSYLYEFEYVFSNNKLIINN